MSLKFITPRTLFLNAFRRAMPHAYAPKVA